MKPQRGQELEVQIDALAAGGRGVGRSDGYVVFVPLSAPGDRLRVRLTKTHRSFGEAEILELLEPGPSRTTPPCPYFGRCGGCAWQHLDYGAQLAAKADIVRESLARLGGIEAAQQPILPAPSPLHYRNKMEFAFHPEAILGLHLRGHFDRVLEIDECLLPGPATGAVLREVKAFVREKDLTCWDKRSHQGQLRHLVLREARATGELLVGVVTSPGPFPEGPELAARLVAAVPGIASIVWAQSGAISDTVTVDALEVLHGRDHIFEELAGVRYAIRLETFFQTNSEQANHLAELVLGLSGLTGREKVIDLYCGVGAFALLLAPRAERVWGIEVVAPSIEAARENAARAGIENAEFVVGDARRTLPEVLAQVGEPDLLVIDPPRSGAGGKVMRRIGRSRTRRVIYVSCNPTTLAPDLAELMPYGYDVKVVQPIDLFPQTWHVETVVVLDRVREPDEGVT